MEIPLTLTDYLNRAELVYGDQIAVIDEPDQPAQPLKGLTYKELSNSARSLAAELDELGIELGSRIAMVSQNSARMLIFLFGTSAFGRIGVPINFRLNKEEVAYIVEHSGAEVLLIDPELKEDLADINVKHLFVLGEESDHLFANTNTPKKWTPDENATATINYTSGTTARPKGVEMTHRNLWLNAAIFGWQTGVTHREV